MPTLAIAMIVKNEAKNLRECLESVRPIANEIVIGDTGSSDDTIAIARQYGAHTLALEWRDDFAWARNEVLKQTVSDWILHLDADEFVDDANARRIRKVVDADGNDADAIEVTLANYCDDPRAWRWVAVAPGAPYARGHAGYIRTELLRLFRNGKNFEYREPVHENITESVLEREGVIRREPIMIHHYGHRLPSDVPVEKALLYLRIAKTKAEQRPNDVKAWHDFAEQCLACGDAATAEQACRHALSIDEADLGAGTTLSNLLLNRGDLESARRALLTMRQRHGDVPHVVTALAAISLRRGDAASAKQELSRVLERAPNTVMARYYLARACDQLTEPGLALRELESIMAIVPSLREFQDRLKARHLRDRGEELYALGKPGEALALFVEALRHDPDDPVTHNDLGVVAIALGDSVRAKACFEAALCLAPGYANASDNLAACAK
jgi:Flp pilus assembly protein TadD